MTGFVLVRRMDYRGKADAKSITQMGTFPDALTFGRGDDLTTNKNLIGNPWNADDVPGVCFRSMLFDIQAFDFLFA